MANLVESPANITDKRSARKAENRIAIVEAAESLILEGGYGALNAEALAERAGVSRRTIFNHFASVDDVLVTRMNQYFNRIFEECDFSISGENASMEAEMLSIARNVFMSNTLEEYIAPFAHLLYALEMDSPAKSKNTRTSSSSAPTTSSSNSTSRHTPTCPTCAWQSSPPTSPKPSVKASTTTSPAPKK